MHTPGVTPSIDDLARLLQGFSIDWEPRSGPAASSRERREQRLGL